MKCLSVLCKFNDLFVVKISVSLSQDYFKRCYSTSVHIFDFFQRPMRSVGKLTTNFLVRAYSNKVESWFIS